MAEYNPLLRIAVIVPCYNEASTIGLVVEDFQAVLPDAQIFVFDNNSSDATMQVAQAMGAQVHTVLLQGKGNVIRRMFADIEADVYVMVDGDATYDVRAAPKLVNALLEGKLDMVVGNRISDEPHAYRLGHRYGNMLLTRFTSVIFGHAFKDILSGYRVFSRRYVKSFPAHSAGFEIETELSLHAFQLRMPIAEIDTFYKARPAGSYSKLNTYRDGLKILRTIFQLFESERPLLFFWLCFLLCAITSITLALPLFETYFATGLVPRIPTAIFFS